jgi:hypothetical protein
MKYIFFTNIKDAGAYPRGAPFMEHTLWWAPGLSHLHYTWIKGVAKDKQSSLLCPTASEEKTF